MVMILRRLLLDSTRLFLLFSSSVRVISSLNMEFVEIVAGVHMPVMSIGCGGMEKESAHTIVTNWLNLGGTGIDTALVYGDQDEVRRAISESTVQREDLFITTKIPDCNASNLARNFQENLDQLGTSYVDLMLIHAPRRGDCVQTWKLLESYYRSTNQTRAIGVSNFQSIDLQELLTADITVVPHVNQIKLNILERDIETTQFCDEHGIHVEAYSPLGRGNGEVVHHPLVKQVAAAHNVTEYQIALKWILQHRWILTFQSSSEKHQAVDADVFGFHLDHDEMYRLDQIGDGHESVSL